MRFFEFILFPAGIPMMLLAAALTAPPDAKAADAATPDSLSISSIERSVENAKDTGDTFAATTTNDPEVPQDGVFPLPEIAVSGKRITAPPTLIVREVSIEDMAARHAHTVGEALNYVPGVNVQIGGSSGDARAWIRGYRDRDVLVLFDGIPVASSFEGTVDLNEIAVQRISTINVLKSAPSVIYGTNGVGGVIDVIPDIASSESFADGRVELGSDDEWFTRVSGGGGNGNVSFALSAQHQQADDYSLSGDYDPLINQPSGDRLNSDFKRSSVLFQMDAQESPIGHTSLFYNYSDADKGLPVEAGVDDPDFERLTKSRRQTLGLSNEFTGIPLNLKLFYNTYDSELTAYTDSSYSEVDAVDIAKDYSYGGKLYYTVQTSANNTLVLSAGEQTEVFKGEGELEEGNKAELTTWTLAIEDQFWISQKLSLAAGGIFSYFDQTRLNQSSSKINPQIALAWQAMPQLAFHVSAAQRTRFPKLRELYRDRYGNPDLKPQTANNYEVGFTCGLPNGWNGDFAFFHSDVDDLIERADRRAIYTNFDRVIINGIETAIGGWISSAFFARFGYTWVDNQEKLPDGSSRQLRSRPTNTAIAELRYLLPHDVNLYLNGSYVSGLYDLDPDGVYTEISSSFVANFKATWAFNEHYEAYFTVSNIADSDYLQRIGDPREGRRFMLGLNFGY